MLADYVGKIFRAVPDFKGKHLIGRRVVSPLLRGRGRVCLVDMRSYGGGRLLCQLDDWIPWNVFLYGNYEVEAEYERAMLRLAEGAHVVIDVGANIGYYTVQFARLARGPVYGFEPLSHQFGLLEQNIRLNGLDNVKLRKQIVSDQEGMARVYFAGAENTGMSSVEQRTDVYEDVPATSLDAFALQENLEHIDILKIDVEGHEPKVLHGARQLLAQGRIRHLFVEINERTLQAGNTTPAFICRYLQDLGYEPQSIKTGEMQPYSMGSSESLVYFHREPVLNFVFEA